MTQSSLVFATDLSGEALVAAVDDILRALPAVIAPMPYAYTDDDAESATHVWLGAARRDTVKVVEDADLGLRYALVEHRSAQATIVEALATLGRDRCEALRARLIDLSAANAPLLVALTLCDDGKDDPRSALVITRALSHRHDAVRRRAAMAAALARWPSLHEAIVAARAEERDTATARLLDAALGERP